MATYVAWKPYYSVGDSSLDAEHQQILGAIDELYSEMSTGKENPKTKKLLDRLVQYTLTHFQHEERIMQEAGYPAFPAHKTEHERMRQRTAGLRANLSLVKVPDLLRFLKEWWTNHIQAEDKSYSPYLGSGKAALPRRRCASGCDSAGRPSRSARASGGPSTAGGRAARKTHVHPMAGRKKIGRRLPAVGRSATPIN